MSNSLNNTIPKTANYNKQIIETLLYFDIFNYPLLLNEIGDFLARSYEPISFQQKIKYFS